MSTNLIQLDRIHCNPHQTRPIDQKYVDDVLAPDIATRGLLQAPLGRPHPTIAGDIELAFGHHRLAAFQVLAALHPKESGWQQMAVEVVPMDDRQMFERAVAENEKRKPTSLMDKARTLKKYIDAFHVTQGEAGKLFGLEQAGVSNLISLLVYPEAIQKMIDDERLPLRYAWMLKSVAKFFPERAINAAGVIAKSSDEERERVAHDTVRKVWESLGVDMDRVPWPLDWIPDAVMSADIFDQAKGEPKEPPACKGCSFLQTFDKRKYCARKPCYQLKKRIYARREADRLARKLEIPLAGPDEKVTVLYEEIPYGSDEIAKLMDRKPEGLRLLPRDSDGTYHDSRFQDVIGSEFVTLAATNRVAVLKSLEGTKAEAKAKAVKGESEAAKKKRLAQEAKEEIVRRKARAIANREKWEILWLLRHTAEECAKQMEISGGVLIECERLVEWKDSYNMLDDLKPIHSELAKRGDKVSFSTINYDRRREVPFDAMHESLSRQHIIFDMLCEDVIGYHGVTEAFDWQKAREAIRRVIEHELCLVLPKDWDRPPILKTEFNCWQCGTFAPGEKITGRDKSEGWLVAEKEKKIAGIYCPDHAGHYQNKVKNDKAFKELAKVAAKTIAKNKENKK